MTPADAFFIGYMGLGAGASLPPGSSINVPDDLLKPHDQASSYIHRCEIVGLTMDSDGVMMFDCQRIGESIKLKF